MPIKVLTVVGTRPEVIKLAPVVDLIGRQADMESAVCVTAQHRQLLDQMLDFFSIKPDYDLDIMRPHQDLFDITANVLTGLRDVLRNAKPDLVLVQGDTTTCFAGALAAYYEGISVGHVEAGLRTGVQRDPFPEELNRQLVSRIADYHFTTTERARRNLIRENVGPDRIWVTGSTGIDSLRFTIGVNAAKPVSRWQDALGADLCARVLDPARKLLLVTLHRRENFARGLENVCHALKRLAMSRPDLDVVLPVHLNPSVRRTVIPMLQGCDNIHLREPMDYDAFVWMLERADVVVTDSGGVQEEAPYLGVPVLVARVTTERQESVECGAARVVGLDKDDVARAVATILDGDADSQPGSAGSPYGDGRAADRIVSIIRETMLAGDRDCASIA